MTHKSYNPVQCELKNKWQTGNRKERKEGRGANNSIFLRNYFILEDRHFNIQNNNISNICDL